MPPIPVGVENPFLSEQPSRTGYRWLTDWRVYTIEGADAATYLHTQTTNDVVGLADGQGQVNALVDRKAHWQALFLVYREQERYWILVESPQDETLFRHLDTFHFIEDVAFSERLPLEVVWVGGPTVPRYLMKLWEVPVARQDNQLKRLTWQGHEGLLLTCSLFTGETAWLLAVPTEAKAVLTDALQSQFTAIDDETWERWRIEAGFPKYGVDVTSENLLPETGLERMAVNYNKGCYLGQEVVARIKTYGVVPKALMGLVMMNQEVPPVDADIEVDGKRMGQIKSGVYSPTWNRPLVLAYLHRDYRQPGRVLAFTAAGREYTAELKVLPFYQALSAKERANDLYEQALTVFAGPQEAEAILLLEEALAWDPSLKDVYEVLGVILSRQEQHQAAIEVMTRLTEVDPTEPMAHTNLSVFYMRLGQREMAEKHMAEASRLNMLKQQQNQVVQTQAQDQRSAKQPYIDMFKEVLETEDPDDLVANYGLGKIHVDLQDYVAAIPYLEKAIKVDRFYSAAYLTLGKALEGSGQVEKALDIYRQGIVAASQKGDLMPMKEMEQRQQALAG